MPESAKVPKIVFIVPYRNREKQYLFFKEQMKMILEDMNPHDYEIMICHQSDDRHFNRGAIKNIGFLVVKAKYPDSYKNITLVFNDVDTVPRTKNLLNYQTVSGTVKHFYGFKFTLGGIVSINARDFEMINGFPNFWSWGYEDNVLQQRAINAGLVIDRSQFYPIGNTAIIYDLDGPMREVNSGEFTRFLKKTTEGIRSIYDLEYNINSESGFVDIVKFSTGQTPDYSKYSIHDLNNGPAPFDTKFGLMYNNRTRRNTARMGMIM
jgi:hypothetical protein